MFGQNEVTKAFQNKDGSLLVNDLWYTIQGEGPDAGRPAIFLRLSKCNLRCFFCDTEFEKGGLWMFEDAVERIGTMAGQTGARLLVITGGEPCLQNFVPLIECVNKMELEVSIETAGTVWLEGLQNINYIWSGYDNKIICSPKTPKIDPKLAPWVNAFKYIIRAGEVSADDGLPSYSTQVDGAPAKLYRPPEKFDRRNIFVQPMDEPGFCRLANNTLATVTSAMMYGYRLSLQMHKIVGVP